MCELLGMCFNMPVQPKISFRAFRRRGRENPDGWGIAFYPDSGNAACVFKEPLEAMSSRLSEFIAGYERVRSKIFIAHVRLGSMGSACYENTHPFVREVNGKDYTFAHNGTLYGYRALKLGRFKPIGDTDSEYVFCYILYRIEERIVERWTTDDFKWLHEIFREINRYGTFNCLLSDGTYLFCYYDRNGYNGLCLLHRKAPFGAVRLLDEDWEVNLAEEKDPRQEGYIVATRPLTNEEWQPLEFGEMVVFKDGKMVFPRFKRIRPGRTVFNEVEEEVLRVLRSHKHRVPLREIIASLEYPEEEVRHAVRSLLCRGYIKQDSRDSVDWNHPDATFYTRRNRRALIDRVLGISKRGRQSSSG